eukprot:PhM_4_TR16495/c0_g2_i1/m.21365
MYGSPYQQQGYPPQQQGYPPQQQQQPYRPSPSPYGNSYQQQQAPPTPPSSYGQQPPPQPQGDPLWGIFSSVDTNHNGRLDAGELQRALSSRWPFRVETAQKLVRMFDRTGNGTIEFDEFRGLFNWVSTMYSAFQQVDTSRNGLLDGQEVRRALQQTGYQLSEPTFQLMMRKLDRERRGEIGLDGYIEMCIFLGMARNIFGFYDNQRTGQVSFNFDSFCTANLSMMV